jgi:voltage-gated potassium channel
MATERDKLGRPPAGWRLSLWRVIWESDTPAGKLFDEIVIAAILLSVGIVIADSVQGWHNNFRTFFVASEWLFTVVFTLEYIARLASVERPWRYARSFYGIVDLLAVLPTYLALFFPELHALIDVRLLRLLRIFRIFKLTAYIEEYQYMGEALLASRRKIFVFLMAILIINLIMGTLMYVVEGPANGFRDIPTSVYWAVTTMTTVGFGDITAKTDLGRFIASAMMLVGWGTLAVPTGIVTAEMTVRRHARPLLVSRACGACGAEGYGPEARFCQQCGTALPPVVPGVRTPLIVDVPPRAEVKPPT